MKVRLVHKDCEVEVEGELKEAIKKALKECGEERLWDCERDELKPWVLMFINGRDALLYEDLSKVKVEKVELLPLIHHG